MPGHGRLIDLSEFEMLVKADAASTGGLVSVLEATEPPGWRKAWVRGWRRPKPKTELLTSQTSMVGYFDDLAAALGRADVTDDELASIAQAHSMEIVGPPSERYV